MRKRLILETAKRFALRPGEDDLFDASWELYRRLAEPHGPVQQRRKRALEERELEAAMVALKAAVTGTPTRRCGHRWVKRLPVSGRYVVFSDHHIAHDGHRHDFFRSSGNLALYVELLQQYRAAGFTVVEGGDVEDLVVYDPSVERDEVMARRGLRLRELRRRRLATRLAQLERTYVCAGNQALLRIWRLLASEGRLLRIAGNHDYDLQRPAFLAQMSRAIPGVERPFDYLLLADEEEGPRVVVAHGHQFDRNTLPALAPRYGETISECLGAWFQGADRKWYARDPADGSAAWGAGARSFRNHLVTDAIGEETGWASLFEHVFQGNIAWEYFEHGPLEALVDEVAKGERFFKIRHLDEEGLRERLLRTFPDEATRPLLVLGHSHEPRLEALSARSGQPFGGYVNTASAGLYQNLVWGVELIGGAPTMVSWRRVPGGPIERRTWRSAVDGRDGWLMPEAAAAIPQ